MTGRFIVMLGTDLSAPGGITAVVRSYAEAGLFDQWPIRFLPTFRRNVTADKLLVAAVAFVRFLGWVVTGQVAAVHAHTAAKGSFWRKSAFLLAARFFGGRAILHLHDGTFPSYYEKCGSFTRRAVRYVFAHVDAVVALSAGWAKQIQAIESSTRLVVIPNAVKPSRRPRCPARCEVLFLGRLWREKGIFDLVEAAVQVAKRFPEVKFVCAGDGDIPALTEIITAAGVFGNFAFPGWVEGEEKDELLARATVFVLPSYFEGLPMGVLEAMANGVPVVATNVGGIPEALETGAGIVVPPGAPALLGAALIRVLGDESLRQEMATQGQERARSHYHPDLVMERIGDLYRNLGIEPSKAASAGPTGAA